jgi:hypothetical protein
METKNAPEDQCPRITIFAGEWSSMRRRETVVPACSTNGMITTTLMRVEAECGKPPIQEAGVEKLFSVF